MSESGENALVALLAQRALVGSPWPWAVGGVLLFACGLVLVVRPQKSGEIIHKVSQALRPWRVGRTPKPVIVIVGCFGLLLALGFLYTAGLFLLT